jgi:single-stranded DNA-specific DHH superfamily exonuclease
MEVGYSLARTINTGNFENAKFEVSCKTTCDEKDVESTFKKLKVFVDKKVKQEEMSWRL